MKSLNIILTSTDKTVFTTNDFNKIWKYDNYRSLIKRINYLSTTGKIIKIKRGLYSIDGREINEFELANKLRTPSYISFETVLYKEGVIFQWDSKITLAGKESISLELSDLTIVYRQLKDNILLNAKSVKKENNYYVASKERALLDMLYIKSNFHFDNLAHIDFDELDNLIPLYGRKNMLQIVNKLKKNA